MSDTDIILISGFLTVIAAVVMRLRTKGNYYKDMQRRP